MAITSFRVREELQDPLEQAATELRPPKAWIINEALAAYFERENQDQRMYRETLEGLADVEGAKLSTAIRWWRGLNPGDLTTICHRLERETAVHSQGAGGSGAFARVCGRIKPGGIRSDSSPIAG